MQLATDRQHSEQRRQRKSQVVIHFEFTRCLEAGRCPPLLNLSCGQRPRLNEVVFTTEKLPQLKGRSSDMISACRVS